MSKHIKKLLASLLAIAMVLSMMPSMVLVSKAAEEPAEKNESGVQLDENASVYSGTADRSWYDGHESETTYTLTTADQLMALAAIVNGGVTFAGKTIKLGANMVINKGDAKTWSASTQNLKAWTSIGSSATKCFSGTFDGDGYYVSGVYSVRDRDNGFFNWTVHATIKNFALINSYFENKAAGNNGQGLASFVGRCMGTTLQNLYTDAILVCNAQRFHSNTSNGSYDTPSSDYVTGGIVGFAYGATTDKQENLIITEEFKMENCVFAGTIDTDSNGAGRMVGGLVGFHNKGTASITNSWMAGTIYSNDNYVGGVLGQSGRSADLTISQCLVSGRMYAVVYQDNCGSKQDANNDTKLSTWGGLAGNPAGSPKDFSNNYYVGKLIDITDPDAPKEMDMPACGANNTASGVKDNVTLTNADMKGESALAAMPNLGFGENGSWHSYICDYPVPMGVKALYEKHVTPDNEHNPSEEANCGHDYYCLDCGDIWEKAFGEHVDADPKDHFCDVCATELSEHVDEDENFICDYCEANLHRHSWKDEWVTDEFVGWHECANPNCDAEGNEDKDGYHKHAFKPADGFAECETCGYQLSVSKYTGTPDTSWYNETDTEFVLYHADELYGLAELVNSGKKFAGKIVKLGANIVINEGEATAWASAAPKYSWTPAGTSWSIYFGGTFDGQNHYISGLYCPATVNNALFGFAVNADIKNLGLVNSYQVMPTTSTSTEILGSFVGKGAGVHLDSLYSNAILVGGYQCVGGIVAFARSIGSGASRPCEIRNCVFAGYIYNAKYQRIGGIVGTDDSGTAVIENCLNLGQVNTASTSYNGGIVGMVKNGTAIRNCVSVGYNNNSVAIAGWVKDNSAVEDKNVYVENCYYVGGDKSKAVGGVPSGYTVQESNVELIQDILAKGKQAEQNMPFLPFDEEGWTAREGDFLVPTGALTLVEALHVTPGHANPPVIFDHPASADYASAEDSANELEINAITTDGGELSYQWYENSILSNVGGTPIEGANEPFFSPDLFGMSAGQAKYFYCVVTNTNSAVEGEKTASVTSDVAVIRIEKEAEEAPSSVPFTINGNPISNYTIVWGESDLTALQNHPWYNDVEGIESKYAQYVDFKQWLTNEDGTVTEYNLETAQRLQAYIKQVCGVELPIASEAEAASEYQILITKADLDDVDKYEISVEGNSLIIRGGSYGATWHALDYLESLDDLTLAAGYKYRGAYDMITIGMVGDSITHGSNSSMYVYGQNIDGNFMDGYNEGDAGASQVGVYTALAHPAQVGRLMWKDVVVYNYGHAGIMLTRYRAGVEWPVLQADAHKLDYVTIMLGTNDAKTLFEDGYWGEDDETLFFNEYKAIIETLESLNPNLKFMMLNSPMCWQKNNPRMPGLPFVLNAQEATYKELSKTHTMGFVDMYTLTAGMKAQFTDDIHPNNEGYVMFANIISGYLKSFIATNGMSANDAGRPTVNEQPISGGFDTGFAGAALKVEAVSPDFGTLSYQWYVNSVDSNVGGTAIEGATEASYTPDLSEFAPGEAKYYYCVVTNTNADKAGSQMAAIASEPAEVHLHKLAEGYNGHNATHHWSACVVDGCGELAGMGEHTGDGKTCSTCGWLKANYYGGTPDKSWYEGHENEEIYILTTPEQLYGFAQIVNSGVKFIGKTIKLGADMVINSGDASTWNSGSDLYNWTPIGTQTNYFSGTFDGDGHYISGLWSVRARDNGFFFWAVDATIQNVAIVNSYIENNASNNNGQGLATFVSRAVGTNLKNLYTDAILVCNGKQYAGGDTAISSDYVTGGIVAFAYGNGTWHSTIVANNPFVMENCIFAGTIDSDANGAGRYVGGLVGYNNGGTVTIQNCLMSGAVISNDYYVGGVLGYDAGSSGLSITQCVVSGQMNAVVYTGSASKNTTDLTKWGGIVGEFKNNNSGIIINNYYHGALINITDPANPVEVEMPLYGGTKTCSGATDNKALTDAEMMGADAFEDMPALKEAWTTYACDYPVPTGVKAIFEQFNTPNTQHNPGAEADCGHDQICLDCGTVIVPASGAHVDADLNGSCDVCGESTHVHSWKPEWENNEYVHWHECANEDCFITQDEDKDGYEKHAFFINENGIAECETCHYELVVSHYDGTPDATWYNDSETEFILFHADQLFGLAQLVNGGKTFQGKTVKLAVNVIINKGEAEDQFKADLDAGTRFDWTSIGTGNKTTNVFSGTFDGLNHYISGMYYSKNRNGGMFWGTYGATIKNFALVNTYFVHTGDGANGQGLASFVGWSSGGITLQNLYTDAILVNKAYNGSKEHQQSTWSTGGIVAFVNGDSLVEDCVFAGSITDDTYGAGENVGGIVGTNENGNVTIQNCLFAGTLSSNDSCVGGIIGRGKVGGLKVLNCVVVGEMSYKYVAIGSGSATNINRWGAIAGYLQNNATIENCFYLLNAKDISGDPVALTLPVYGSDSAVTATNCAALTVHQLKGDLSDELGLTAWTEYGCDYPVPTGVKALFEQFNNPDTEHDHSGADATCGTPKLCPDCGDILEFATGDHVDENEKDHICDVCEQMVSACIDTNPRDHECDICGKTTGEQHVDTPNDGSHNCQYCGQPVEGAECSDADNDQDHLCDECGEPCGEHTHIRGEYNEPTTERNGYYVYTCNCGHSYEEEVEGTKLFTITWIIEGEEIKEVYAPGTMPEYKGEKPEKAEDDKFTYEFIGWTPEFVEVSGDASYTAVFEPKAKGPILDSKLNIAQVALSMREYIGLQFVVMDSTILSGGYTLDSLYIEYTQVTADGETITKTMSDIYSSGGASMFELGVNAWSMTDVYTVTIYAEKDGVLYCGEAKTSSVQIKAMEIINRASSSEKNRNVCIAMLNYGAAVQAKFKHNLSAMANAELSAEQQVLPTAESLNLVYTNEIPAGTIKPALASLNLGSVVKLTLPTAKASLSGYDVEVRYTINGEEQEPIPASAFNDSGDFVAPVFSIKPSQMRSEFVIAFYDKTTGEKLSGDIKCSVEGCAKGMVGKTYNDIVLAMMQYSDAVVALSSK